VRGLIGETWRLLRVHGRALLLVALILLVPAELAAAYAVQDRDAVGVGAYLALTLVGYPWVYGALLAMVDRRTRSLVEPYGRTVDRLPALVLVNFAAGIVVVIGLVLLIVPGLLIAARWAAAGPLIVIERKGPFEALETSNSLIRGRTWTVVGAFVVVLLVSIFVAVPAAVGTLTETVWLSGLSAAALDVVLFLPLAAFGYAVYRQTRAS
jgi:hypothetical protein